MTLRSNAGMLKSSSGSSSPPSPIPSLMYPRFLLSPDLSSDTKSNLLRPIDSSGHPLCPGSCGNLINGKTLEGSADEQAADGATAGSEQETEGRLEEEEIAGDKLEMSTAGKEGKGEKGKEDKTEGKDGGAVPVGLVA